MCSPSWEPSHLPPQLTPLGCHWALGWAPVAVAVILFGCVWLWMTYLFALLSMSLWLSHVNPGSDRTGFADAVTFAPNDLLTYCLSLNSKVFFRTGISYSLETIPESSGWTEFPTFCLTLSSLELTIQSMFESLEAWPALFEAYWAHVTSQSLG